MIMQLFDMRTLLTGVQPQDRPTLDEILINFDDVVVGAVVRDDVGRKMWKKAFGAKVRVRKLLDMYGELASTRFSDDGSVDQVLVGLQARLVSGSGQLRLPHRMPLHAAMYACGHRCIVAWMGACVGRIVDHSSQALTRAMYLSSRSPMSPSGLGRSLSRAFLIGSKECCRHRMSSSAAAGRCVCLVVPVRVFMRA